MSQQEIWYTVLCLIGVVVILTTTCCLIKRTNNQKNCVSSDSDEDYSLRGLIRSSQEEV